MKNHIKLAELLTETPQTIPPMDAEYVVVGIDDCLKNMGSAVIVEKFDKHAALYELQLKGVGYYFVMNSNQSGRDRIEYFVRFKGVKFDKTLVPGGQAVRQVLLWRNKTSASSVYSVGIARKVFWELLFPRYRCLASDNQQTDDGKKFWSSAVGSALDDGLTVRIVNTNDRTFDDVTSKEDFIEKAATTWGTARWFQRMIIVIFEGPR